MRRKNQKGFSLVELLAVVAVIGILAIIAVPNYQKFRVKTLQAEAKTLLAALHASQHSFFLEYQGYHSSLKVLGVAPQGRSRYNIGFGDVGTVPANAPTETNFLYSKRICSGAFGLGADLNCEMILETPEIANSYTVTATGYSAAALGYEDLLIAQSEHPSTSYLARLIIGKEANASTPIIPSTAIVIDGWFINQDNQLSNQKLYDKKAITPN
ncbi:MAG: prepilin-type N-terminal cleavage/methylation domain-containing protein [Bdellovibrionaceae bacterium]|nr:prepilin-type N-terminal cleavage/methylation domain-containing protein [Pseudobdellovibrionaceae bacterium]